MSRYLWFGICIVLLVGDGARGASSCPCGDADGGFVQRIFRRVSPAGGWRPYGTGWLHWWPCCCFPLCGAPDDYCRKPLPKVCWPPYPPYYTWGPPVLCQPQGNRCQGH
jgi:hypothetical protein